MEKTSQSISQEKAERLKSLGLDAAAKKLGSAEKMQFAYGKYLFVTQSKINEFNQKLCADSQERDGRILSYKNLVFIKLSDYAQIPPEHALDALEKAKADACFDEFEVAKIEWIRKMEDPIIFGVINGCDDKFFITQWDDDVKIEDILFMG